jgi:hypothetical protein
MPLGGPRRGRPGLVGTAARTAVIAGTATAVSGNVARRQAAKAAPPPQAAAAPAPAPAPEPAPAPAPAAAPVSAEERLAQLERLAGLHAQGILTDAEFAVEKARILG